MSWDPVSQITDLDGDGVLDEAVLGRADGRVYVAVALGNSRGSDVIDFAISSGIQEAVCAEPAVLSVEELVHTLDYLGAIDGLPDPKRAAGLRLSGGECDSIHLYWNRERSELDWWRL